MASFFIQTLGCKLNQFESEGLAARLLDYGLDEEPTPEKADIVLINTCTVTEKAHLKSLKQSRLLASSRARFVFLLGCDVEQLGSEPWDERVIEVPNPLKSRVPELVLQYLGGKRTALPEADPFDFDTKVLQHRTRCFLKVQDGCDVGCAYCIVPLVRGRAVSRNLKDVQQTARNLLDQGAREIVLTGINIAHYHSEGVDFNGLLRCLLDLEGEYRLRLSSLEPSIFQDEFYELMNHPRMARHLHLSLQSGSDPVLRRMGRPYTSQNWLEVVQRLRQIDSGFHVSTDIIVGFPGETEVDFESSLDLLQEARVGKVHIFPFSPRRGTQAYRFGDKVSAPVMNQRLSRVRLLAHNLFESYQQGLSGLRDRLLIEKSEGGAVSGWLSRYVYVNVPDQAQRTRNTWVDVLIQRYNAPTGKLEVEVI